MKKRNKYFFIIIVLIVNALNAQVGIGTNTPNASSVLEIESTNAGFLPPRITTSQRDNIISPSAGLIIYNTTINCLEWWNGNVWQNACGSIFNATIPLNPLCYNKTISKTPCNLIVGATLNDDSTTPLGVEYDWSNATNTTIGIGLGATTNTRALVEIGGQCWCRYNMNITNINLTTFANTPTSAWSGYYNDATSERAPNEGRLYQWTAAMQGSLDERDKGICPVGFHIPSDCEWMFLEYYLGMSLTNLQNSFLRNSGDVGSDLSTLTLAGTNSSGFTGLLGGWRDFGGLFNLENQNATWWSSSETRLPNAVLRGLTNVNSGISRNPNASKAYGFCVRCIKD